jgi:hypothetical protein
MIIIGLHAKIRLACCWVEAEDVVVEVLEHLDRGGPGRAGVLLELLRRITVPVPTEPGVESPSGRQHISEKP